MNTLTPRAALNVVTPPTDEPIDPSELKLWLGYDTSDGSQDLVFISLIRAARRQLEHDTGLAILTQTVEQTIDRWPCGLEPLQLYVGPVQSISFVKSYSTTDVETEMSNTTYMLDASRLAARILLKSGVIWPSNVRTYVSGLVRVVAGYTTTTVPEPLLHAMRLLIQHWHDDCDQKPGTASASVQTAYDRLIESYKLDWL